MQALARPPGASAAGRPAGRRTGRAISGESVASTPASCRSSRQRPGDATLRQDRRAARRAIASGGQPQQHDRRIERAPQPAGEWSRSSREVEFVRLAEVAQPADRRARVRAAAGSPTGTMRRLFAIVLQAVVRVVHVRPSRVRSAIAPIVMSRSDEVRVRCVRAAAAASSPARNVVISRRMSAELASRACRAADVAAGRRQRARRDVCSSSTARVVVERPRQVEVDGVTFVETGVRGTAMRERL